MTNALKNTLGIVFVFFTLSACAGTDPWWMGSDKLSKEDAVETMQLPPPEPIKTVVQPAPVPETKIIVKAKKPPAKKAAIKAKKTIKKTAKNIKKKTTSQITITPEIKKEVVIQQPVTTGPSEVPAEIKVITDNLKKPRPRPRSGEREIWCYRSIGRPDCYNDPLPGEMGRLIAVDPPSKTPRSTAEYQERVNERN